MSKSPYSTVQNVLDRLVAAATDGRAHNIRYRQDQLHLLHAFLRKNAAEILAAIVKDSGITSGEAEVEYYLAMNAMTKLYNQLDFEKSLEAEYAISSSRNNVDRRVPFGIVRIKPDSFTRFYSIIVPAAAALASGNCVLLELLAEQTKIDSFLKEHLTILDHDSFAIVTEPIANKDFLSKCITIDQTDGKSDSQQEVVASQPEKQVLAIVDRTANVKTAANEICNARFAFGGRSPYAPDVVLINEFAKKEFIQACLQRIHAETATLATSQRNSSVAQSGASQKHDLPEESFEVIFESNKIRFVELHDSTLGSLSKRVSTPTLIIASVTGLVDAVTIASKKSPLLACHCFADPQAGKFLSQHIDSDITFVNHIPSFMLVGPAMPTSGSTPNIELRYDTKMLSIPRPEIIEPSQADSRMMISDILSRSAEADANATKLRAKAVTPLKPTGQPSGTSMGFFGQGIITGIVAFVLPALGLIGYGGFRAISFGLRYYKSR